MKGFHATLAVATVILLAATTLSYAQTAPASSTLSRGRQTELGMTVGVGQYTYDENDSPGTRESVGAEACLLCGHRALFVDYSHWTRPNGHDATLYGSADTGTAGLRVQWRKGIRPFFDIGVAVGNARFEHHGSTTSAGLVIGAGVTVAQAEHFYLRFRGRVMYLSQYYIATDLAVGAGWRF